MSVMSSSTVEECPIVGTIYLLPPLVCSKCQDVIPNVVPHCNCSNSQDMVSLTEEVNTPSPTTGDKCKHDSTYVLCDYKRMIRTILYVERYVSFCVSYKKIPATTMYVFYFRI